MKHRFAIGVALSCIVSCATVAAIELWPARRVYWADQNGDGRPDIWRRYDVRGQLTEVDVDSNFDGHADIQEYYERGVLVRRESDRNFNGQSDLVEEFDAETHNPTRSVIDLDYDGTADLLVLFRDGQQVFTKRAAPPAPRANRDLVPARHVAVGGLARLTDPFESETAVRTIHVASADEDCVGLSTSGGLPRPHVALLDRLTASARLVARDQRLHPLTLPLARSPRAPPAA